MTFSASKLVFVIMALAVCGLTYLGMVEPKDFVALALLAFGFYYGQKDNPNEPLGGK